MKTILFFLISFVAVTSANSQKPTKFSVTADAGLGLNVHRSSFIKLPGIDNCCTEFKSAFGAGFIIGFGGNYLITDNFFGMKLKGGLNLMYDNANANFLESDFFANIIVGNELKKGIVDHSIETNIQSINFQPYLSFAPLNELPLWISVGASLKIISSSEFRQEERLMSPPDVFFENLKRVRNEVSGAIPSISGMINTLNITAKYKVFNLGMVDISPFISGSYAISNVIAGYNWQPHSLAAGINLEYNFLKSKSNPPIEPPVPLLPDPPKSEAIELAYTLKYGNNILQDESSIAVKYDAEIFEYNYIINPITFFEKNGSELRNSEVTLTGNTSFNLSNLENLQKNSLTVIIDYLKQHKNGNVIINSTDDEDPGIGDLRVTTFRKLLNDNGINDDGINIKTVIHKIDKLKNPELSDEYRSLQVDPGEERTPLYITKIDTSKISLNESGKLLLTVKPKSGNSVINSQVTVKSTGQEKNKIESNTVEIEADKLFKKELPKNNAQTSDKIELNISTKDIQGNIYNKTFKINTDYKIIPVKISENTLPDNSNVYVLGYFDYDESKFSNYDPRVLEIITTAVNSGNEVEIIPLTDYFGTEDYNSGLAGKRAESAMKLIGQSNEKIKVKYPLIYMFPNDNPWSRILNRSVIVRIMPVKSQD